MINARETRIQEWSLGEILGETNAISTVDGTQKDSLKQLLPPLYLINSSLNIWNTVCEFWF